MIYGLCGAAQAGKDSTADILVHEYDYKRYAFADELRALLVEINPTIIIEQSGMTFAVLPLQEAVAAYGWDFVKTHGGRELLQNLGASMRKRDPEFWIDLLDKKIAADQGSPGFNAVITDCRHLNELAYIRSLGGAIVRIERPGVGPINDHISEHEWRQDSPEFLLKNGKDLTDLLLEVVTVLQPQKNGESDDGSTERSGSQGCAADEPDRAFTPGGIR